MQSKPVYLALSREGLAVALQLATQAQCEVWCGASAISDEEYQTHSGPPLSRFDYELSRQDVQALHCALETIEEHHPGQVVLVEGESPNPSFNRTRSGVPAPGFISFSPGSVSLSQAG